MDFIRCVVCRVELGMVDVDGGHLSGLENPTYDF